MGIQEVTGTEQEENQKPQRKISHEGRIGQLLNTTGKSSTVKTINEYSEYFNQEEIGISC